MDTQTAARMLAELGHPTRLEIHRLLVRAGPDGLPVGALQQLLGLPASTLSHHILRLVNAGLVTQERVSRQLICRPRPARLQALLDYVREECCAGIPGVTDTAAAAPRGDAGRTE